MTLVAIVAFAAALMASLVLTPLVAALARRRGWLDLPDGGRKLHTLPVPRCGGVAVFVAFGGAWVLAATLAPSAAPDGSLESALPLLLAATLVMLVGFVDDVRGLSPLAKVLGETAAALLLWFAGYRVETIGLPWGGVVELGALALPVTLAWIVGMCNAFNLIDGLDGLAAGVALVATGTLVAVAAANGRATTLLLTAALAGALLGFLRYNFNPAKVFLGDSGSLTVGFLLAAFAIGGNLKSRTMIAVAVPLVALALPIFDASLAVLRRLIRGGHVTRGDRDHIHHRMLRLGLTPRRAVMLLYGVSVLLGSLALAILAGPQQTLWAAVLVLALLGWLGIHHLGYVEMSELRQVLAQRLFSSRRTTVNNLRLLEVREAILGAPSIEAAWGSFTAIAEELGFLSLQVRLAMAEFDWARDSTASARGSCTWDIPIAARDQLEGQLLAVHAASNAPLLDMPRFAQLAEALAVRVASEFPTATSESLLSSRAHTGVSRAVS
jgi:UDP-GlcNAc:undecaprenyl-phosphate/decaprenyl-phosphate GlcNAc-1-phosphate transferase